MAVPTCHARSERCILAFLVTSAEAHRNSKPHFLLRFELLPGIIAAIPPPSCLRPPA